MQVSGWVPLCFWALHRYAERRRLTDALLASASFVLAVLTSLYFAFVLLVPLGYAAFVLLRPQRERRDRRPPRRPRRRGRGAWPRRSSRRCCCATSASSAAHGFERTTAESARYSADVVSYVSVWHQSGLRPFLRDERTVVRALFPGFIIAGLAAAAFRWRRPTRREAWWMWGAPIAGVALCGASLLRRTVRWPAPWGSALLVLRAIAPLPETTAALYGRIAALAFLLSLGPVPAFDGSAIAASGPHAWLIEQIPGASRPADAGPPRRDGVVRAGGPGRLRRAARAGLADAAAADRAGASPASPRWWSSTATPGRCRSSGSRPADRRRIGGCTTGSTAQGPGPVMHLPIADADLRPEIANASVQLTFHYATLLHGQPTVTGGTDFMPRVRALAARGRLAVPRARRRRRRARHAAPPGRALRPAAPRRVPHAARQRALRGRPARRPRSRPQRRSRSTPCSRCGWGIRCRATWRRPPPPERGPPQRVQCRYLDAGQPDPPLLPGLIRRDRPSPPPGRARCRTGPSTRPDGPST